MGLDLSSAGGTVIEQGDLRARLRAEMARHGWSQADTARRMEGVSQTTLNQWLNGKYPGSAREVEARVERFLATVAAGEALIAARVTSPAWIETPTARTIWAMLAQAQHAPDIVVIAGSPGLGKTETAKAYAAANSNVWIATMDTTMRGANWVLTEVALSMGVRPGSPAGLRRQIGERIDGTGGLIVIDEAQHPAKPALDMLRSLHDRYGIGLALLGNHGFYGGTSVGGRSDNFAQFFSRVGARRRFEGASDEDVRLLLDAWGIEDGEARRFLLQVASRPGALRAVDKCVKQGMAIAAAQGETLLAAHLKAAWAANA